MSNAVERLDDWLRDRDRGELEAQIADLENKVEYLEQELYEAQQDLEQEIARGQDYRQETDRFMYEIEGRIEALERAE